MKIKIKKSVLKQAVEQAMKQGFGRHDNQLIDRIIGLTPRDGNGIDEKRFVDLLNMVMKLQGGRDVLLKFLELNEGTQYQNAQPEPGHMNEVTPPGKQKMVKALKHNPNITNPWAVRWRVYDKEHGIKPKSK